MRELKRLKDQLDPFSLAQTIEDKLERIYKLANGLKSPKQVDLQKSPSKDQRPLSKVEKETMIALSRIFPGLSVQVNAPDNKRGR
jgi:hypothetical protein